MESIQKQDKQQEKQEKWQNPLNKESVQKQEQQQNPLNTTASYIFRGFCCCSCFYAQSVFKGFCSFPSFWTLQGIQRIVSFLLFCRSGSGSYQREINCAIPTGVTVICMFANVVAMQGGWHQQLLSKCAITMSPGQAAPKEDSEDDLPNCSPKAKATLFIPCATNSWHQTGHLH